MNKEIYVVRDKTSGMYVCDVDFNIIHMTNDPNQLLGYQKIEDANDLIKRINNNIHLLRFIDDYTNEYSVFPTVLSNVQLEVGKLILREEFIPMQ